MITKATNSMGTEGVLSLMHPVVSEWFRGKFGKVTEAQSLAVPLIHGRRSVLVSSPTGSGKTLTAFLSIINELALKSQRGELEDRIYAVYVSPLKALANDINENLLKPLGEISAMFEAEGLAAPGIKVAVRTGDTLPSERQRQAKSPPHIFITTPESLSLILSTPVFSRRFDHVDYVIVDEVHEICDSKRGAALSVALERLQSLSPDEFVRIGLSATVAPIEQVAEYLAGLRDGHPRDMSIVEVYAQRDLDLRVICPTKDMTALSFEVVNSKMYDMLKEMVEAHRTTLVFTNTRSGTESVVYKLKERGLEGVGAHHGSLSRETRLEVEDALRGGGLRAVVSSTSLELGIDIGSIDLVVQIGSPKSVAKGLQRVGRAGHQYGGTSKGRIIVFENDDLVECAVLCRAAHRKMIDRVTIPANPLDVLAQSIVGLSIERPWTVEEAFRLFRQSYSFKDLGMDQMESVLRYLGGKDEFEGIYSKIWYDEPKRAFGMKHGSRMIFYLNQGTIPEEADYTVYSERGSQIGSLSEKFVERLSQGDIFVLGGRSYEFVKTKGTKAFVKGASGRKPTVPSWTGEMLPRSFDLSLNIGRFRGEMDDRIGSMPDDAVRAWLMDEFDVDEGSANTIVNYFREQKMLAKIPTDDRLVVEGYIDASGNRSAIFHFPFGRRVNDALSRVYAHALSSRITCNVTVSVTDDCFMLTAPRVFDLEGIETSVRSDDVEGLLRASVRDSELFTQRFRHVATRSFMVLRNYKGKEFSVARQQLRSQRLLDALHELDDFPVMTETYAEILTEVMDVEHAREVLRSIERKERAVEYLPFSGVPSPFAHNVILVGVSDIVLMEDRSMLLRELHRKVLAKVLGEDAIAGYKFESEIVAEHYRRKFPRVSSKHDILTALSVTGPMNLFREKGENVFAHADAPFDRVRAWASELLREGRVRSVWVGEDVYVTADDWSVYSRLHRRAVPEGALEAEVLSHLRGTPADIAGLADALGVLRVEIREAVRRLESANAVYRSDIRGEAFRYSVAPATDLPSRRCTDEVVTRHLEYHAPLTVEDLAYEVGIPEQEVLSSLQGLLSSEVAVSGRFVVGEQQQYMLAKDYLRLQERDVPVFDRDTVRLYAEAKHFSQLSSVKEFFEKFGEDGMAYDVFQRVRRFDMAEFGGMRTRGELVLGRFVRGRLRYVLAEDAPHYLGVYRRGRLNRFESEILRTIRRLGSGTYQEIAVATRFPPDVMREHFDSLDRKAYLVRFYDEAESWSSRNVYAECAIEPEAEDPYTRVLMRYLRGHGPVTTLQTAAYLDMDPEDARRLLARSGAGRISVGLERTEMFLLSEELPLLESFSPRPFPGLRILSLNDPFLSDKWPEISARYGEGWFFPVVHEGRIVGMVEKWLMAGAVEIRSIELDDHGLLGRLIDGIDSMMPFYNSQGVEVVRVRSVFGTDAAGLHDDVVREFINHGYSLANGMLVKGRLVTQCFDREEILEAVLGLQNLRPSDRLEDVPSALARYGGFRTDAEVVMRVRHFESLHRLHKRGEVVRGHLVPDRVGYCAPEDAGLYRAARQVPLTPEEDTVLKVVRDQQPVKRDRLLDLSPHGTQDTLDAMKSLYSSSRIYLDASLSYVLVKRHRSSRKTAWPKVIRRMFDIYGIMTAESLAVMLGHEIPMRELRKALRSLEDDGHLVKGYLLRGSGSLHWATREAIGTLGQARFAHDFVLAPEDGLTLYLRAGYRELLPETGRYAVFSGPVPIGSFSGRVRDGRLEVADVTGPDRCHDVISEYARRVGLALAEPGVGRISDLEIMEFYRKSHPGGS